MKLFIFIFWIGVHYVVQARFKLVILLLNLLSGGFRYVLPCLAKTMKFGPGACNLSYLGGSPFVGSPGKKLARPPTQQTSWE
jgi:hypothetical protein